MPEPLTLEYGRPVPQPGVVRATLILGLACGPLAYGLGGLLYLLSDNIPLCWAGVISPFVAVAWTVVVVYAFLHADF
jgi:hypothetical protein